LRVVDLASGQWRRIDGEHFGSVFGVAFSPDGGLLASASADGRLRLSRASSFATVLDFYPIVTADGPDWLSITPEGYFATNSGEAAEAINVRVGGRVQRLDQFYDVFYRPDIVMRKVRGDDISSLVTQSLADAAQKRPPRLTALRLAAAGMPARDIDVTSPQAQADVGSVTATGTVSVSFEYAAEGAGIGEVRVFHNGKLVSSDGSHRLDAATGIAKAVPAQTRDAAAKADRSGDVVTIAPVAGENVVSVLAFDRSNSLRSAIRSVRFVADRAQSAPRLYTVVVGVDRYRDTTIPRLALAVKDATDFARTLASRTRGTFGALQVEAPVLLFDGDATRANILQAIERVASRMQPQDTFVWYVAGHGILEQSMYVLVPHDFDQARIMESGLNGNDLLRIAQRVPALQQVFVLDTCHAGGVDRVVGALYDARMTVLARKMGLHLMAGATDVQNALDKGPKGSNGLFTESILDAMEGPGADEDSDGLIQVNELARFATRVTQEKARKLGHAQDPVSVNVGRDFAITRAAR
jgi:hypothetical protein